VTQANPATVSRHAGKSGAAYRTTSEVSEELDLPARVLRFWESEFPETKLLKRGAVADIIGQRTSACYGRSDSSFIRRDTQSAASRSCSMTVHPGIRRL
jgi:hypothetical protein